MQASQEDLRTVVETVAIYLALCGVALVAPDSTADMFQEATERGGGDERAGVGLGESRVTKSWTVQNKGSKPFAGASDLPSVS